MSSVLDEVVEAPEPVPDFVSVLGSNRQAVLLSLDIGTSGLRICLFDDRGNEIAGSQIVSRRQANSFSAFGELNPDQIFDQVVDVIDELFENFEHDKVEQVAISCFWHSLMGIDVEGNATTLLLTWADTRAAQFSQELRATFDEPEIHNRTGCRFHSSYWPAKLNWLKAEHTAEFKKTKCWVGLSEYLSLRLFGTSDASVSMASATGLLNQSKCDWDWSFVDALGIARDTLPVVTADQIPPCIREEFASRWPPLAEATLATVIGDGAANNIGGGCCTRDRIALMVGTSGAMRVVYKGAPPAELPSALWCYRIDRKRVVVGGALSDGGGLYRWLTDLMSLVDAAELEADLARIEPDAHGLTVLPFWSGERSPGWSPAARGGILGLTQKTRPAEIVRAALEGISYRFALIARALDQLAPGATIVATGNALRSSPVWLQILTDVLGRPLIYGGSPEASIRGAALLALETVGKIGNIEEVAVTVDEMFEPDLTRHLRYQEALNRQEHFYQRLFGS